MDMTLRTSGSITLHTRARATSQGPRSAAPLRWWSFVAGCACLVSLAGTPAQAQELNTEGNLVFGAERLFGIYLDNTTQERGNVESDRDITVFGLGWQEPASFGLTVPRLAVDYFLNENLTLGGSLGIYSMSGDVSRTGIILSPRVGYALRLSRGISFWPRGGITFVTVNGEGDDDANVFSITLEGMFTFAPSDGWAFHVGPALDLGLAGEVGENVDYTEIMFGLMMGLSGWVEL